MSDNTEQAEENTAEVTESTEQTAEQQPQEPQNLSERPNDTLVQPTADDLILGKFKSQEDLEQGYKELEKYVGGNKDELRDQIIDELSQEADSEVPEHYELPALPEHITEDDVMENPMTEWWRGHCAENAYDQEMFENGINAYIDMMGEYAPNADAEIQKLGENAQARIQAVDSFSQAYFSPDEHEYLSSTIGTTAEGIEILEKIMQMRNENISSYQQQEPLNKLTLEDVRGMMKDPRYFDPKERDESFVRKVDDAFARLYR
jgi:hypothetical protein|tara:strand:- start:5819 stop:6604 length:786 start_codon:yes stop_codon:yes gene_type:complete